MKHTKKAESPSWIGTLAKIILSIIILGFAGLAIHNSRTLRVELDNSLNTLRILQTESDEKSENINSLEGENKSLQQEKENLELQKKELEEKLQAK